MKKNILITGGAGFIGSHLADELILRGHSVRLLDNLTPQVHGETPEWPEYLPPQATRILADIRNRDAVRAALEGVDVVFHFAARVGVGQSMYEISEYVDVNVNGTAILLEEIINNKVVLDRLVVASSMSIYGEGLYKQDTKPIDNASRTLHQLKTGEWEVSPNGTALTPAPTDESKTPDLSSVYALTKFDQERLCIIAGRAYQLPVTALRFFNVYGSRQALSNPYTGVLAIFASRLLNDNPPIIFEDGKQLRDFVSVKDIVQGCCLAMEKPEAIGEVFNIGSGVPHTVKSIAMLMGRHLEKSHIKPILNGKYRVGDIRHCFADISKAQELLDYEPSVSLDDGITDLVKWLKGQAAHDRVLHATSELDKRGLTL